jgi:ABC-type transporter lipoprotein component MlaA
VKPTAFAPPYRRGLRSAILRRQRLRDDGNDPADPFEGFNRAMFAVNEGLDKVAIKPVAQGYDAVTPLPVKVASATFSATSGTRGRRSTTSAGQGS